MFIYGVGSLLFDMLDKHKELRGKINRVFDKDSNKIGMRSKVLGVIIEAPEEIRFLPYNSRVVIGESDFATVEREVMQLNPHVRCVPMEDAVKCQDDYVNELEEGKERYLGGGDASYTDAEKQIYMGLYDLSRMNLRNGGNDIAVGRVAFWQEIKAQIAGAFAGMDIDEMELLADRDYVEAIYMRVLKRTPPLEELNTGMEKMKKLGRYGLLRELVDMRIKKEQ